MQGVKNNSHKYVNPVVGLQESYTAVILAVCKKLTKGMEREVWEAPLYTLLLKNKAQRRMGDLSVLFMLFFRFL